MSKKKAKKAQEPAAVENQEEAVVSDVQDDTPATEEVVPAVQARALKPKDKGPKDNKENRKLLKDNEAIIREHFKTFLDVFQAMLTIREKKLYRLVKNPADGKKYTQFAQYLRDRFDYGPTYYSMLKRAAETHNALCESYGEEAEQKLSRLPQTVNFYAQLHNVQEDKRQEVIDAALDELTDNGQDFVSTSQMQKIARDREWIRGAEYKPNDYRIRERLHNFEIFLGSTQLQDYLRDNTDDYEELKKEFNKFLAVMAPVIEDVAGAVDNVENDDAQN